MQIGSEMATLQEKNPKMDPKKRFFLKNPPGFLAFEKSSSKLTSNRPFWLKQIFRDIKFILRGLPERCAEVLSVPFSNDARWSPSCPKCCPCVVHVCSSQVVPSGLHLCFLFGQEMC